MSLIIPSHLYSISPSKNKKLSLLAETLFSLLIKTKGHFSDTNSSKDAKGYTTKLVPIMIRRSHYLSKCILKKN